MFVCTLDSIVLSSMWDVYAVSNGWDACVSLRGLFWVGGEWWFEHGIDNK